MADVLLGSCFDCGADAGLASLGEGLDAVGADAHALAIHAGPLKVWLLASLSGWVVVTTQKHAAGNHSGSFIALWAFDGHEMCS